MNLDDLKAFADELDMPLIEGVHAELVASAKLMGDQQKEPILKVSDATLSIGTEIASGHDSDIKLDI